MLSNDPKMHNFSTYQTPHAKIIAYPKAKIERKNLFISSSAKTLVASSIVKLNLKLAQKCSKLLNNYRRK